MTRGLILDLDNTLYNWVDSFAPSFRAMLHVLARVTELNEETIIESFRKIYKKYNTVEYSFAIQELDIWNTLDWSKERILHDAVKPARVAFGITRRKHSALYPNVRETLYWAKAQDLLLIAYSVAPIYLAEGRLRAFKIDHLFSYLYSWYGYSVNYGDNLPKNVEPRKTKSRIPNIISLDISTIKPNPNGLIRIINECGLDVKNSYLVGDSLDKDIALAQEVGVNDIWARYGKTVLSDSISTLSRITPWNNDDVKRHDSAQIFVKPTYIIDDFSEIKNFINPLQLELFSH